MKVKFKRWPWQSHPCHAPLNPGGARFGGGWKYVLGISLGGTFKKGTIMMELIYGVITITWGYDNEH